MADKKDPKFIQWTTHDGETFFPVGKTTNILPPGCYKVQESMQGFCLQLQDIKDNTLIDLPDSNAHRVMEEISKFWGLKEKFAEHKMPYKRGLLLYGPPGSGKTSTLRVAMEDVMQRDGIVIEYDYPRSFLEGYKIVRQIHPDKPIVALMEDLDSKLSYGETELLQMLDGVHDLNNIVFVATTNYPEKLGSRIFNRPSRFDKKFKIGMPSAEARKTYLAHKGIEEDIDRWVDDTDGMSIAHLAELYTAVKVFEEDYDQAIKVVKSMESIPHSSLFDRSSVDCSPESVGKMYYEHKAKLGHGKTIKESKGRNKRIIKETKKPTKKLSAFDTVLEQLRKRDTPDGFSIDAIVDSME